jgi:hypothetical protein
MVDDVLGRAPRREPSQRAPAPRPEHEQVAAGAQRDERTRGIAHADVAVRRHGAAAREGVVDRRASHVEAHVEDLAVRVEVVARGAQLGLKRRVRVRPG